MHVHRNIRYRLIPGTHAKSAGLSRLAGACRYVWNAALEHNKTAMTDFKDGKGDKPSTSFFTMGKWFTGLRRETDWLQALPFGPVRYTLKYQAEAFSSFFKGSGFPRFKSRYGDDTVTIPDDVRIRDGKINIPKLGWYVIRRRGGNPYGDGKPVKAVIKRELGKWYYTVCYEVDVEQRPDDGLLIGVDMNAGQVADSTGVIHRGPETARLEARRKRYARKMARQVKGSKHRRVTKGKLARTARRIANAQSNWQHHVSKDIAGNAGCVAMEALNIKGMTAKGGTRKRGLNRVILNTGWHGLKTKLNYKALKVVDVPAKYTSQTCYLCGYVDQGNRRTQALFECQRCGYESNADINAALNIMASGIGASGRRAALGRQNHCNDPPIYIHRNYRI